MSIFQIAIFAIIAAILMVSIRSERPEIAMLISVAAGVTILIFVVSKISAVINVFNQLTARTNIDLIYLNNILKIIGIAYVTEFSSQVCKDVGEGNLSAKVELAGKIFILIEAIPIILALLNVVVSIMP
ncbi:stage III sporulation protein AD [Calorimonas adulescens]|jgi:stage III sporulation protein AD|uniref:Stage III sporulation protein AD n=1 Tax=Calorimonas adulescens TaxID=2606906 RepID=A0A5D8QIX7_9THEO|nr:stage III sporulation protein AD [Calorimonas adulescens]TZE83453.1 stage III sporulation protein AD [Calorimonas adulescens]